MPCRIGWTTNLRQQDEESSSEYALATTGVFQTGSALQPAPVTAEGQPGTPRKQPVRCPQASLCRQVRSKQRPRRSQVPPAGAIGDGDWQVILWVGTDGQTRAWTLDLKSAGRMRLAVDQFKVAFLDELLPATEACHRTLTGTHQPSGQGIGVLTSNFD